MFINESHEKAINYLKNNDLENALFQMNLALDQNGLNPDLLSDRAVVYLHLKQKINAINDFDSAINLQPNYGYRYSSRAYARDIFGDTLGAMEDYQHAIDLDPEDAISFNNLGMLEEKLGRLEQAKRQFAKADALRKLEDLNDAPSAVSEETILPDDFMKPNFIDRNENNEAGEKESFGSTIKESLFTKAGRIEVWKFIRNGFKIKH